jgi:iron(III) transport system ATP-binding protein
MTSALSLENISHRFGPTAVLGDFSLSIEPGTVACLLGPSGSGKTTALRIAAGLEPVQQGTVTIGGQVVGSTTVDVPPERRDVGLMFQDYALFPHLSVAQNVGFGLTGKTADQRASIVEKVLAQVGMAGFGDKVPYTLSGGEQQRVALARALAPAPRVMLMDEPFSGLDYRLRDQIRDDTLTLLKATDTATLLVTHDPDEAMLMADKITLMRAGQIVQTGTPEDLFYRPSNAFAAEFFGEINVLHGIAERGRVANPLGILPAPELPQGNQVKVLIRPHDLQINLDPNSPGQRTIVRRSRLIGGDSLIDLVVEGTDISLRARVPGALLPETGALAMITMELGRAFVFAVPDGQG